MVSRGATCFHIPDAGSPVLLLPVSSAYSFQRGAPLFAKKASNPPIQVEAVAGAPDFQLDLSFSEEEAHETLHVFPRRICSSSRPCRLRCPPQWARETGNLPRTSLPKCLTDTATGSGFPRPMKQATSTVWAPSWATMWRSKPTAKGSFRSRTAQSLPLCTTVTSRRTKTTKSLADAQSFVPGAPTNIQFMVKDSKKYAATGGWGFAHFQDGKPGDAAFMKPCFCHEQAKGDRLCLHSLYALTLKTRAERTRRWAGDAPSAQHRSEPMRGETRVGAGSFLRFVPKRFGF